ncbi:MAG TPA: hypothetical protein VJ753_04430 [Rhizomicrobium sp.]|nr:hypothetical protein [Rhizomicrobium sp.]
MAVISTVFAVVHRAHSTWFAPLGAISYSLYASHLALIWLAWHTPWLGHHGPRPVLAAGLALAAVGQALLYRLVDPAAKARGSADYPRSHPDPAAVTPRW